MSNAKSTPGYTPPLVCPMHGFQKAALLVLAMLAMQTLPNGEKGGCTWLRGDGWQFAVVWVRTWIPNAWKDVRVGQNREIAGWLGARGEFQQNGQ